MSINLPVETAEREHTCERQHPDDPTACMACVEEEAPMLVCDDCGEAFDEIVPAYVHTFTNEDGLPEACGREFRILPRDEAL